jgi:hypothetical protein
LRVDERMLARIITLPLLRGYGYSIGAVAH